MMRVRLAGPPRTHFAPDCDASTCVGVRVRLDGGREIGTVTRAYIEDSSLWADVELDVPPLEPCFFGPPSGYESRWLSMIERGHRGP